jgi:hypothetical protein
MSLNTREYPTLLATIKELGLTDRERAAEMGVTSTKTVERIRRRLPAALKPFVTEPRLLRALLADLERKAA